MGVISFFSFLHTIFPAEEKRASAPKTEIPLSYAESFPPTEDEESLPPWLRIVREIAKFCGIFFGLCFLCAAGYLTLALVTYNPDDPNWDVANGNPVQNMAGILGADLSNVHFQFFGISSFFIALLLAGWGMELIYAGRPGNLLTRALGGIGFIFSGAASCSLLEWIFLSEKKIQSWHHVTSSSIGGEVGDYFAKKLLSMVNNPSLPITPEHAVFLIFICLALLLGTGAIAFRMPPRYFGIAAGAVFALYRRLVPEKAPSKKRPKHTAFNDSPFSDLHHPPLGPHDSDPTFYPAAFPQPPLHPNQMDTPWISKPAPSPKWTDTSDTPPANAPFAPPPNDPYSAEPVLPQPEDLPHAVSTDHLKAQNLPESIFTPKNAFAQNPFDGTPSPASSAFPAEREFSAQKSENAPFEPFEPDYPPRPHPHLQHFDPPLPEEDFRGTPSTRNTYNLHRDEGEDADFHYSAFTAPEPSLMQPPSVPPPAVQAQTASERHPPYNGALPSAFAASGAQNSALNASPPPQAAPSAASPTVSPAQSASPPAAPAPMAPPRPAPPAPPRPRTQAFAYSRENWQNPSLSLLEDRPVNEDIPSEEELKHLGESLEQVLGEYKIKGKVVAIRRGPVATLFEFCPIAGTRESQIVALSDDIARSLAVSNVRITRVSGRNTVGLEVPNQDRDMVSFLELLRNPAWTASKGILELALGKNVTGKPVYADLAKMPHLLVAGTTGSGKSVGMNAMLLSLLFRLGPEDCRMILVDPKKLEFSLYEGIPHLLTPVITEADKALGALRWAVGEMERRYQFLADAGVRNIISYNHRAKEIREGRLSNLRTYQSGNDPQTGMPLTETIELPSEHLPYIVIVIDEMADLMMTDGKGKEIEAGVVRLAQKARACGIHLIIATQRPSADVITGLIKANFPSRIAFQVTNKIDSRIVLDAAGGEQLLGNGDMLFRLTGKPIIRLHGAFISEDEVDAVANDLRSKQAPIYNSDIMLKMEEAASEDSSKNSAGGDSSGGGANDKDELYDEAVEIVFRSKRATASFLQRQLSIGYNRASKIIEMMEDEGIVSAPSPSGKREILRHSRPPEHGAAEESHEVEEDALYIEGDDEEEEDDDHPF